MKPSSRKPAAIESRYLAILSIVLLLFTLGGVISFRSIGHYRDTRQTIDDLVVVTEAIRYYDEVLTMSARMAAYSGDGSWRQRYDKAVPQLDDAIGLAVAHVPKARAALEQTRQANQRLITLEQRAFLLAEVGRLLEAQQILGSAEYDGDKKIYSLGVDRLLDEIRAHREEVELELQRSMHVAGIVLATLFSTVIFALLYGFRVIAERLDMERLMSEAGRQLLTYDGTTDSQRLCWILQLLASKAQATHAFLLHRQRSSMAGQWRMLASFNMPENLSAITLDALVRPPDEDGNVRAIFPETGGAIPENLANLGIGSLLGVLLNHGTGEDYYLGLGGERRKMRWDESEAPILRTLAELMAGAVDIHEKEAALLRLATTDELTGLDNRRCFTEALEREMQRVARSELPSALLMIDLDHFKRVNDTHGHAMGDRLLRRFAVRARELLREIDVLGRIGGEEFAIILPGADQDRALAAAERLRGELAGVTIDTEAGPLHVTISTGVTLIRADDAAYEVPLKRADKALYAAKNDGRNCVRFQG